MQKRASIRGTVLRPRSIEEKAAAVSAFERDVVPALVAVPGGALAAWSRFVEGQYRVVVARFGGGGWSEPTAVGEPGSLFPTLTRTERGALLLHQSSRPPGWTVVACVPRSWA